MCNPTALMAAQGAGAASSAVSSYYTAKGEKLALQGQADLAESNARISELAARSAIRQGQKVEQSVRLNTAQIKSSQRASMAARGIDLSSETPINVLTTTDVMGEIDANTAAANAARTAWGYRTEGVNFKNDALLKRATSSSVSPMLRAGTSLLTGATDVGKSYYTLKSAGAKFGGK